LQLPDLEELELELQLELELELELEENWYLGKCSNYKSMLKKFVAKNGCCKRQQLFWTVSEMIILDSI
jgi:predicted nucleotidyltransferase